MLGAEVGAIRVSVAGKTGAWAVFRNFLVFDARVLMNNNDAFLSTSPSISPPLRPFAIPSTASSTSFVAA